MIKVKETKSAYIVKSVANYGDYIHIQTYKVHKTLWENYRKDMSIMDSFVYIHDAETENEYGIRLILDRYIFPNANNIPAVQH